MLCEDCDLCYDSECIKNHIDEFSDGFEFKKKDVCVLWMNVKIKDIED